MINIAVDMMGSDLGPEELSQAVKNYRKDHKDVSFTLFGDEEKLKNLFASDAERISIVSTTEIIPMEIKPLDFLRKKNSSMYQAILSVKDKKTDGVITAGSTGGFVSGSTILLRNIEGIRRAGLCTPFPTMKKGVPAVIMDVGANNVNTAEDLVDYAKMARIYSQNVLHVSDPKTFLLTNGTEEGKGTDEIVKAYSLLKEMKFPNFAGNVEARNALDGNHDVIITGGFEGNIFLKATEGMASMMNSLIKKSFKRNLLTKIGYLFSSKGFKEMKETMDYRRYGGAILLGVNGVAVKAHGNSNAYAFYHAMDVAYQMIQSNIIQKIKEGSHD